MKFNLKSFKLYGIISGFVFLLPLLSYFDIQIPRPIFSNEISDIKKEIIDIKIIQYNSSLDTFNQERFKILEEIRKKQENNEEIPDYLMNERIRIENSIRKLSKNLELESKRRLGLD